MIYVRYRLLKKFLYRCTQNEDALLACNSEKHNIKTILSPQIEDQKSNLTYWTQPSPEHQILPSAEEEKDPVSVVKIVRDSKKKRYVHTLNC